MNDNQDPPSELNLDVKDASDWPCSLLNLYLDWERFSLSVSSATELQESFISRCLDSAAVALALRRYCACAETIGFVPVSFSRYVERLESMSDLAAEPVLRHFGITERNAMDTDSLQGFATMWRALRITLREAVITLRITLMLPDIEMAGIRLRGTGAVDSIASCEKVLKQATRSLTPAQRAKMFEMERRLAEVYEEPRGETSK